MISSSCGITDLKMKDWRESFDQELYSCERQRGHNFTGLKKCTARRHGSNFYRKPPFQDEPARFHTPEDNFHEDKVSLSLINVILFLFKVAHLGFFYSTSKTKLSLERINKDFSIKLYLNRPSCSLIRRRQYYSSEFRKTNFQSKINLSNLEFCM